MEIEPNTKFIVMNLIKSFIIIPLLFCTIFAYGDKLEHLRSARRIITVHDITAPYFTIQILALAEPPGNPEFFNDIEVAREFISTDGFVRYTVGEYRTFAEAARDLDQVKAKGYQDAFVLNLRKISLKGSDYQSTGVEGFVPDPNREYTIQLAAYRFPVYVSEFEQFETVYEFYMQDRIFRYTTGRFLGNTALQELENVKRKGYPDAFLVRFDQYERYRIE